MVVAVVGAAAVFAMVADYVADVRSQVEPMAPAMVLAEDLPAHQPLDPGMVRTVERPERWVPEHAVATPAELTGLTSSSPLPAGTLLQDGMLEPPPEIADGQREIAILVDAETGVGGKVRPGSQVDVVAAFQEGQEGCPEATYVVEDAQIVEVGSETVAEGQGFAQGEVVPITFALSTVESLRVAYIESFASSVRLALRSPLDDEPLPPEERTYDPLCPSDDREPASQPESPDEASQPESPDDAEGGS